MSETLTYDAGTDTVTTENNLNEDEQSSLIQGERMEAQEEQLLAGKYKDAQELEAAYKELEKKLGEKSDEVSEEVNSEKEEKTTDSKEEESTEEKGTIIDRVFEAGQNNKLNDDLLKELRSTSQEDLAKIAIDLKKQQFQSQPQQLTDADVSKLKSVVGGEQSYDQIMTWAQDNIPEQDIKMFDEVIEKGDPLSCYFAVQAIAYRYQEATGRDGQMLTGKAPKSTSDVFKSQAELIKAMEDSRYSDDPAYREAILDKLERSNINF